MPVQTVTDFHQLKLVADDGKLRLTDVADCSKLGTLDEG
jgi:hypothetical protein